MQNHLPTEEKPRTLIDLAKKKLLGRFDTPRPIAQAMADWAVRSPDETVLEPSVGGGVFVRSVSARLSALGASSPLQHIFACDIDPTPCAEVISTGIPSDHVHLGDFLNFTPKNLFSAVVGNPPYISLRHTNQAVRDTYFAQCGKAGFKEKRGSIWAHFVVKAHSCLAPGGRLAFLLPEAVLYTHYGRNLLNWATERFSRCSLISIRERCFVTEGTDERVVIVLFDGCSGPASDGVAINEFETVQQAINFLCQMRLQDSPTGERINGHVIPQAISSTAHEIYADLESSGGITSLGNLAKINIGVVTGANPFFLLSEEERNARGLRKAALLPCLTKFSDCKNTFRFCQNEWKLSLAQGKRGWLFCPPADTCDKTSLAYIKEFPKELIVTNKTFEKRNPWFRPVVPPTPDAFLRYMGADGPKLALNEAGFTSTNTIHHILFKENLAKYRKQAIALAIQSTIAQLSAEFVGRSYGSGVLKLEPSDCKKLLIPVPNCCPKEVNKIWKQCTDHRTDKTTEIIDDWIYRNWTGSKLFSLKVLNKLLTDARHRRKG